MNLFTAVRDAFPTKKRPAPGDASRKDIQMLNVLEKSAENNADTMCSASELRHAREWISRKLARAEAAASPFAETVTITPEFASIMLARNPADENRNLSKKTVEKYAADMKAGRWQGMNGQTIVISKDGWLNDGQHRLNAIIESDCTVTTTVIFGADRESRMTLDQNKARTSGDYIGMLGCPNANNVAAAGLLIYAYEAQKLADYAGGISSGDRPTKAAFHAYLKPRMEAILHCVNECHDGRKLTTITRLAAAMYLIAKKAGYGAAEDFMRHLIDGDGLRKTDPIYAARERLLTDRLSGLRVSPKRTMETILRGWNAHRRGKTMRRISLTGNLPKIEG